MHPPQLFTAAAHARSGADLAAALKRRLASPPLTRFAPAPTGALHLGHVVNAIHVWGLARALGGRVLLRIEDHDRQRARADAERRMLDDLDWLGFAADVYPSDDYRRGVCHGRQSERDGIYREALAPLISAGHIYGCRCSRADLLSPASASTTMTHGFERRYAGTCRDAGIAAGDEDGVAWRLRRCEARICCRRRAGRSSWLDR